MRFRFIRSDGVNCRHLAICLASVFCQSSWAEEPVPPLSPRARILWDALIEVPPRLITRDTFRRTPDDWGWQEITEEFFGHPQVRQRLAEAVELGERILPERRAHVEEQLRQVRSRTGLALPGPEEIVADFLREFRAPRPLTPRERALRAGQMARSEFERRYPSRSVDDSVEYRLEYSRLVQRFEVQLEEERVRSSPRLNPRRVRAWALRWRARLASEQQRLRQEGHRGMGGGASPHRRVIGIPVTPQLERFLRSSHPNEREILRHRAAHPEIISYQDFVDRFPAELRFTPIVPARITSRYGGYSFETEPMYFVASDSGNPSRRWLFLQTVAPIEEGAVLPALRQGSFGVMLHSHWLAGPDLPRVPSPEVVVQSHEVFRQELVRLERNHLDSAATPELREVDLWITERLQKFVGLIERYRAPRSSHGFTLADQILPSVQTQEALQFDLDNPVASRAYLASLLNFRQAELAREELLRLRSRLAVARGGLADLPELPELVEEPQGIGERLRRLRSRLAENLRESSSSPHIGMPAQRSARSRNVTDEGASNVLYRVRGHTDFLDLIEIEELATERTRLIETLAPHSRLRSVSVASAEPFFVQGRDLAVPTPHELTASRIAITLHGADGSTRPLVRGQDYFVLESLDGRAIAIRLVEPPSETTRVSFRASFSRRPGASLLPPRLPQAAANLGAARLQLLAEHLEEAGFLPLSRRIHSLARQAMTARPVSVEDVRQAFHEEGRYTFGSAEEGLPLSENAFERFSPFLNESGRACMVCGPSERFFTEALNLLLAGEGGLYAEGRTGFAVPNPAGGAVRGKHYHARTELAGEEGLRIPLDATSRRHYGEALLAFLAERLGIRNPPSPEMPSASAPRIRPASAPIPQRLSAVTSARAAQIEALAAARRERGRSALPADRSDPSSTALRLADHLRAWLRSDLTLEEFDREVVEMLRGGYGESLEPAGTPAEALARVSQLIREQRSRLGRVVEALNRQPSPPRGYAPFEDHRVVSSTRESYQAQERLISALSPEAVDDWFDMPAGGGTGSCRSLESVTRALRASSF